MDKANQMEFLFEEGGMADDGLDRDPVSGNEVPSGSMSEEVRDDIPAQLSEGEYVVPADVVRFFGVKYFEDLRKDAKMGLSQMEQEGRIGGEPVDVEGDDTELTAEEQAELDAIMGMAEGGAVTTTYDRLPPQAVGNTGQEQQLANVEQQMTRAFQEGGTVPPATTQVNPDFSNFGAGYSFGVNPATGQPYTPPVAETGRNVTLYGPQGQVVNLILPQDQARYDELTAQGYGETPVAAPVVQQPQVQQEQESASDVTDGYEFQRAQSRFETGAYKEGEDFGRIDSGVGYMTASELNLLETDPLAYGRAEMSTNYGLGRALGAGIGLINPVMGLLAGGGMARSEAQSLNRAETAWRMAQQGMGRDYTQEELDAYKAELDERRTKAGRLARMFPGEGDKFDEELMGLYRRSVAIRDFQNIGGLQAYGGARISARREGLANAMGPGGILAGSPGAQSLAESMDSGYTGAGYRDIAVGKIAGEGQTEGVETRMGSVQGFDDPMPVVVRTAREDGNKVIRRDDQGRPFVYAGAFDKTREYLDEGEAARAGVDMPDNYEQPTESDTTEDKASVICTALFNKGLLSKEIFMLDTQYGRMLESYQPEVTHGYRKLATPLANYIQKDTLGATVARTLVAPVAKAWANEMAHQMQPENYKGNLLGKAIIKLGYPVCAFVGKRSKEIVYGT